MEALGVQRLGYVEHGKALAALAESHAVLCLLDDLPGAARVYPAKIFELMYLGRPCLALTPEGVHADLVRRHALGEVIPPRAPEAICAALAQRLRAFRDGEISTRANAIDVEPFDRRRQAGEFADVFRAARDRARGPTPAAPRPSRHHSSWSS
jgi:hypothetical protein